MERHDPCRVDLMEDTSQGHITGNALIGRMFSAAPESGHVDRRACRVEIGHRDVIQASPKREAGTMPYELSDDEWATIGPMLPNNVRGVPRVDDRHVLNGIFWGAAVRCAMARPTATLRRSMVGDCTVGAMRTRCGPAALSSPRAPLSMVKRDGGKS